MGHDTFPGAQTAQSVPGQTCSNFPHASTTAPAASPVAIPGDLLELEQPNDPARTKPSKTMDAREWVM